MRSHLEATLAAALLAAGLTAQTYSPNHFKDWPGDLSTPYPFSYNTTALSTLRMQQVHDDLTGTPLTITGMALRRVAVLSGVLPTPIPSKLLTMKVTLAPAVAPASATTNWATNYASAGTLVYSGQLSTPPSWMLPPRNAPALFDMGIPFQTNFAYTGSGPFLWDCDVTSASTTDRVTLDLGQSAFMLYAWCAYDMYGNGCAYAGNEVQIRGRGQTVLSPVNQFSIVSSTLNAPANAVATVLIGNTQLAQPVPGLCSNVYTNALATLGGTTDATGKWEPYFGVPFNAAYVGFPLTMQSAVVDASRPGIPVAVSNGLVYKPAPPQPAFSIAMVTGTTGSATATSAINGRATPVKFN